MKGNYKITNARKNIIVIVSVVVTYKTFYGRSLQFQINKRLYQLLQ